MNEVVIHQYAVSDLERMARAFAQSKLFGVTTPEQALALCLVAQAEGRHPASAANDYHIINGRPSKKAEAMLRDFIGAGGKVEWHALDDTQADATFSHPGGGAVRIQWDMKRKQQAGINNANWSKYPRQMLRSRCISEGVRTVYPAATSGMYEPEETREFAVPPVQTLKDVTPPKASKAAKALQASRTADEPEMDQDTGELIEASPAPSQGRETAFDVDPDSNSYADRLEIQIKDALDPAEAVAIYTAAVATDEWLELQGTDLQGAKRVKAAAMSRKRQLDAKAPA
jgi:hypothetical protein